MRSKVLLVTHSSTPDKRTESKHMAWLWNRCSNLSGRMQLHTYGLPCIARLETPELLKNQSYANNSIGQGMIMYICRNCLDWHMSTMGRDEVCHRAIWCRSRGEKDTDTAAMEVQSRIGKNVVEDPQDLPPVILMDEDWDADVLRLSAYVCQHTVSMSACTTMLWAHVLARVIFTRHYSAVD